MNRMIRLINVGTVEYSSGQAKTEIRPNCVDVNTSAEVTNIVMLQVTGDGAEDCDAFIVSRVVIPRPAVIVDAVEGNGVNWHIQAGGVELTISPEPGQLIYVDSSYGRQLPAELQALYASLRTSRMMLAAHTSLLNRTPESMASAKRAHTSTIRSIEHTIGDLEKMIRTMEGGRA